MQSSKKKLTKYLLLSILTIFESCTSPVGNIIEERKLKKYVDIDVTGNDVLLENALEEKADDRLKNIVATIQDEQNKIIRAPINKPLIVQGVAGSRENDYCTS